MIPGAHRRSDRRWGVILAEIGVLFVATLAAFGIGIDLHAGERELLISRTVTACRASTIQTYLMYEACREANQQAVAIGLQVVPLPAMTPAPLAPTTARAAAPTTTTAPTTPPTTAPPTTTRRTR